MLSESTITARMKLRGFRRAQAEAQGLAASVAEVGAASKVAGASAATGSTGITKFQRGVSGLKGVSANLGTAVESGMLRAAGAMETFSKKAGRLKKKGSELRGIGRSMATSVTLPLVGIGYLAIKTAAAFDKAMAQVGVASGAGGKKLQKMRDYAMEMGAKTVFSANESAEAMLNLTKAGITPGQIQGGALATTMNLAAAGSMNLADAGNLVGAMMHTFNMKAGESVRIADALAGGANSSTADVSDLSQALAQAGQSANMMDLSINETVGTLAAFADQGLRGSDAGTSMKTFLMRLNPVTEKSKKLMSKLGLSFFDANGNFVGMEKTAKKLRTALGGMTQKQRNAAIQILFGSDAQRAANIVFNAGAKGISKYTKATKKKGAAEKMAGAQMKGLPGAIERLKGSLETAALVIGKTMAPVIESLAGFIEGVANGFTALPAPIQRVIVVGLVLAAAMGPLVWIIGGVVTGVGHLATAAGVLSKALLFLAANPIVLVVAAVIGIGVALVIAYKKVGWFHDAVNAVFNWIKDHWRLLAAILLGPFGLLLIVVVNNFGKIRDIVGAVVDWIKGAFDSVKDWFQTSSLGKAIATPFIWAKEHIVDALQWVIDKLDWVIDKVGWVADKANSILGGDEEISGSITIKPGVLNGPTGKGPRHGGPSGPVGPAGEKNGRRNRMGNDWATGLHPMGGSRMRRPRRGARRPLARTRIDTGGSRDFLSFPRGEGGGGDTHITLEVDGKTLAKVVAKHANDDAARE